MHPTKKSESLIVQTWRSENFVQFFANMETERTNVGDPGPPVSIGRLVLMLTTYAQQIAFLMEYDILPRIGMCHKCSNTISGEYKERKKNERVWWCLTCKVGTSIRFGTVLYKSKMKLKNWILLAYCFVERNRTYAQTSNEHHTRKDI